MNVHEALTNEQIKLNSYNVGNHKTKCPKCQPPHNKYDNPLSVTVDTESAVWKCHHCDWTGTTLKASTTNFVAKPKKVYIAPKTPADPKTPKTMYEYFSDRGISKETVDKKGIYVEQDSWIAMPYQDENDLVVNIKYRTRNKKFKQTPNAKRTLYNYDLAYDKEELIFVEGEIDVLSLIEVGFENVVSLPDGAPKEAKFNEEDSRFKCLENCPLENIKKVIIFTDNDKAGQALHSELLHRFGKDLCWYVDYPKDCKDANEVLTKHGPEALKEVINKAMPYPVDGLYNANQYYGSVIDLYNGNYQKPIEVGMSDNFDNIYKVLKGTFHVVTGIPNHGKSTFLDQMLLSISKQHGWKYAVFSPEHSTQMHLRRLVQMQTNKSFDEDFANRMTREELQKSLDWLNEYFYFIETKDTVPDIDYILDIAKSSVRKYGVNGIVIDPYNEVSAKRSGNAREDEHIRDFISKCKRFARVHDVVVWIVAHPTKLPKNTDGTYAAPTAYDISGASHWSNQSDVILTVHRTFENDTTEVITRKVREQGLYGKIGTASFKYKTEKRCFVAANDVDWDIPQHWSDN